MNIDMSGLGADFWAPRPFFLEPIPELFAAAHRLDQAVGAHIAGDQTASAKLIMSVDLPVFREWFDAIAGGINNDVHRFRRVDGLPSKVPVQHREIGRMPNAEVKSQVLSRDGFNCTFCGLPVMRKEVRVALRKRYPEALRWGHTNNDCNTAIMCMTLQFDHIVPHSHGGRSDVENIVITCGPCNYGRGNWLLEEVGLIDPRTRTICRTSWDGLERMLVQIA